MQQLRVSPVNLTEGFPDGGTKSCTETLFLKVYTPQAHPVVLLLWETLQAKTHDVILSTSHVILFLMCMARGLEWDSFECPFSPKPFCDSWLCVRAVSRCVALTGSLCRSLCTPLCLCGGCWGAEGQTFPARDGKCPIKYGDYSWSSFCCWCIYKIFLSSFTEVVR